MFGRSNRLSLQLSESVAVLATAFQPFIGHRWLLCYKISLNELLGLLSPWMRIAILSRWNTACGVSLHAELVGREFIKMGHELVVFAPNNIRPVAEDEDYVIRCYSDEGDHMGGEEDIKPPIRCENSLQLWLGA